MKHVNLPAEIFVMQTAIDDLIEERTERIGGEWRHCPSLLEEISTSIAGNQGYGGHHGAFRSLPLIWVDAADVITDIDKQTTTWAIEWALSATGPYGTLSQLADYGWAPELVGRIRSVTGKVEGWVRRISALLDPRKAVEISSPCPSCNASSTYHVDSGGERVRQPALAIIYDEADEHAIGCECRSCNAFWPPGQFELLARVLSWPFGYRETDGLGGAGVLTTVIFAIRPPIIGYLAGSGVLESQLRILRRVAA